jgi:hypothetical protein
MPKNSKYTSNNAQKQGGGGFLSEAVKGECIQLTNNGLTKTEGMFAIESPAIDSPPREPNYYHRPWYGQLQGKQPSSDKE